MFTARRAVILSDRWEPVPNPSGWSWAHGLVIERKNRTFRARGFDVTSFAPTGVAYYVSTSGNDGDTGASWGHALRSVDVALAKADIDVLYIGAGTYKRSNNWDGYNLARSVAIYGTGTVILTQAQDGLTWVQNGTYPNVYQATRSNTTQVLDINFTDANGDYSMLTLQGSVANVDANPGSWYIDGANVVYVRTVDSRAADTSIWPIVAGSNTRNGRATGNLTIYMENLIFIGGYAGFEFANGGAGQTPSFYAKNCQFLFGNGNGLEIKGVSTSILQNCVAAKSQSDGLNYHALNAVVPKAIEIDCVGRDNGASGDDDNGTSIHDGGSIVRLNGQYYRNKGPNLVESAALESWNLGCTAHTSQASIAGARIDLNNLTSGTMWLDRCNSYGSDYGIVAGAGTTIHKRLCNTTVADGGAGTIDTY